MGIVALCLGSTLFAGAATLPWHESFDDPSLAGYLNEDCLGKNKNNVWRYDDAGFVKLTCLSVFGYNSWLITPGIELEQGKIYHFSLKAWAYKRYSRPAIECFEVMAGLQQSVDAMTLPIIALSEVQALENDPETFEATFTVSETGTYYIGIHGINDDTKGYLYLNIDDLDITCAGTFSAPGPVTDLQVVADRTGLRSVDISMKAPTVTFDGDPLDSMTKIDLTRDGVLIHTFENPQPGETLTFTDTTAPIRQMATYTAVAEGAGGTSEPVQGADYVGYAYPKAPEAVSIEENPFELGEVTLTWTPVTEDIYGKPIPADKIAYYIADSRNIIADNLTSNTYTFEAVTEGQDFVFYGVFAKFTGVGNSQTYARTEFLPVGEPYKAPFIESFPNGETTYIWGVESLLSDEGCTWGTLTDEGDPDYDFVFPSFDHDNGCGGAGCNESGLSTWLSSGKVDISEAENPYLSLAYYAWKDNPRPDKFEFFMREVGQKEWQPIAEYLTDNPGESRWIRVFLPIYQYRGKQVQLGMKYTMDNHFYGMLDAIKLYHIHQNDLAVTSIEVPGAVKVGEDHQVHATVENMGISDQTDYTLTLILNGKEVQTLPGTPISLGESADFTFNYAMGVNVADESIYTVRVNCQGDGNPEDNEMSAKSTFVYFPNYPSPEIQGSVDAAGNVVLTWEEPDLSHPTPESTFDSFETYQSFAISNVGDWTLTDRDYEANYTLEDTNMPHNGETFAYIVMDGKRLNREAMMGHTGNKSMASIASTANLNDDWLISPLLWDGEQTITFYAKSCIGYYGLERFEFLTSKTGNGALDFRLMDEVDEVPTTWTRYSYVLPQGTKYFAIRCTSINMFMFQVDDVEYIDAKSPVPDLTLLGYNVYRDMDLVAENLPDIRTFTETAPSGLHNYQVSAVYVSGESKLSVPFSTGESGIRLGGENLPEPVYYNLQGLRVEKPVPGGIYIMRQGSTSRKVVIRR